MFGPPAAPRVPFTLLRPSVSSVAPVMSAVPSPFRSSAIVLRVSTKSAETERKLPIERLRWPLSVRIGAVSVTCVEPPPVTTSTGAAVNVELPAS